MLVVLEYILFFYFLSSSAYVGVFSLAAAFARDRKFASTDQYHKIALLVPAYQEDQVILSVIKHLTKQHYPQACYDIVVIADSFQKNTLAALAQYPVTVLEVQFEKSTKVKSLNYALAHLDSYDIVVISDADNVLEPYFLAKINEAYHAGCSVIQGRRVAKNQNTPFAVLDAANEMINNHIFRKGFNALGLSSALIGSGMAFPFKALKRHLADIHAVGGFDKELQLAFIEKGMKVHYLDDALVFDEKIETSQAFENQRRRWLSSQYIYLKKYFVKGAKALLRGNVSYFNIAVLYNLFLPRMLSIGALLLISLLATVLKDQLGIPYYYWWLLLLAYGLALLIALPVRFFNRNFFRALSRLPHAFFIMLRSLLRMKGANKSFIHTTHTKTEVDNTVFYQKR